MLLILFVLDEKFYYVAWNFFKTKNLRKINMNIKRIVPFFDLQTFLLFQKKRDFLKDMNSFDAETDSLHNVAHCILVTPVKKIKTKIEDRTMHVVSWNPFFMMQPLAIYFDLRWTCFKVEPIVSQSQIHEITLAFLLSVKLKFPTISFMTVVKETENLLTTKI